jgi:hypothetical protein
VSYTSLEDYRRSLLGHLAPGVDRGLSSDGVLWKLADPLNEISVEIEVIGVPSAGLWSITTDPVLLGFEGGVEDRWIRAFILALGRETIEIHILRFGQKVLAWDLGTPVSAKPPWFRAFGRLPKITLEVVPLRNASGLRFS